MNKVASLPISKVPTRSKIPKAFAGFEEMVTGSIAVGKYADFTVFSEDLLSVPEEHLLDVNVVMTIVDGRIAYQMKK